MAQVIAIRCYLHINLSVLLDFLISFFLYFVLLFSKCEKAYHKSFLAFLFLGNVCKAEMQWNSSEATLLQTALSSNLSRGFLYISKQMSQENWGLCTEIFFYH